MNTFSWPGGFYGFLWAFLLGVLLYFSFFHQLGQLSVWNWDEARNAVNALEMVHRKEFLVTYFENQIDMWNVKPPLNIWFMALSLKLFGFNALAVRLPSAFFATLTCICLIYFSSKYFQNYFIGILAVLVLVTTTGYNGFHVARTGDYDALLVLCTTIFSLCYFLYLETDGNKSRYLIGTVAFIILATLTKGVAGLIPLLCLFVYTLYRRKLLVVLKNKWLYLGIVLFIFFVGGYYLLREQYNPGYIKTVFMEEPGRLVNRTEGDTHLDTGFYFTGMLQERFLPWFYLFPFCAVLAFLNPDKFLKRITVFSLLFVILFFVIITFSATKNTQYEAPIYPFAALIIGIGLASVIQFVQMQLRPGNQNYGNALFLILVFGLFALPLYTTLKKNVFRQEREPNWTLYGEYMTKFVKEKPEIKDFAVGFSDYNAHMLFYVQALNYSDKGYSVKEAWGDQPVPGKDIVLSCNGNVNWFYENNYNYEIIHEDGGCKTFKLLNRK